MVTLCVALSGQDGKYIIISIHEGSVTLLTCNSHALKAPYSSLQMFDLLNYEAGYTPIVRRMGKVSYVQYS